MTMGAARHASRLTMLAVAGSMPLASPSVAEPAAAATPALSSWITASDYGPDYSGGDFTRPEARLESRLEAKRSGTATRTDETTITLRTDGGYQLAPAWKLGWVAELPFLRQANRAPDPTSTSQLQGAGDVVLQTTFVRDLSERWSVGFGARLVAPTGDDSLGGGKWVVMPGFGFRYSVLELGADTYVAPKVRYAMSVAGDPGRRRISEPQIAPTVNVGLPNRWFLTLYPSYDIRINYGDASGGQTGRLFLPFDAAIGRKLTDKIVASLEVGVPLIRDYPVYKYKAELRLASEF